MSTMYSRRAVVPIVRGPGYHERTYYPDVIRDAPAYRSSSEKLVAEGAAALSAAELFAVVFDSTSGSTEDVAELSARVIKEYGEQAVMSATDAEQLAKDLAVELPQAARIVAVGELGRRFHKKNDMTAPVLRSARDVFMFASGMRDLSKEHLRGIYLNPHYRVVHDEVISIGTVDANIIHPREVFKPALEYSAAAVILVHNHPSGETSPSDADIAITKQLVEAAKLLGIDLIDHVIVTKDDFKSVPIDYSR